MSLPVTGDYLDVAARTVYGTAGEYGYTAMIEVARNIKRLCETEGHDVIAVCTAPGRDVDSKHDFSCWDMNDTRRRRIEAVTPETDQRFRDALCAVAVTFWEQS